MNKKQKNIELKLIFWIIITLFLLFLAVPLLILLVKSFWGEQGATLEFYASVITGKDFMPALCNSFLVAAAAALAASAIAFILAYTIHYTKIPVWMKRLIKAVAMLPMLLPTITYGCLLYTSRCV